MLEWSEIKPDADQGERCDYNPLHDLFRKVEFQTFSKNNRIVIP